MDVSGLICLHVRLIANVNDRWGCPPGWICKPLQENCDFELGTPDRNFYCSPNECVPAPGLPPPLNWGDSIYSNSTPLNTPDLGVNALDSYFSMVESPAACIC